MNLRKYFASSRARAGVIALLASAAVVVFAAAGIPMVWAVAIVAFGTILWPLFIPLSNAQCARYGKDSLVARMAAAATIGAAASWFALGGLAVYAARVVPGQDLVPAVVVAVSAVSLAIVTWSSRASTAGDLRVTDRVHPVGRSLASSLALLGLAPTFGLFSLATWDHVVAYVFAAACVIAAVAGGALLVRRFRTRAGRRADSLEALRGSGAQFAVHLSGPPGTSYQLAMWLPWLDRIGQPYFIMVRQEALLTEVSALTDVPVVYVGSLTALDDLLGTGIGTVFYVNNAANNTHLIRRTQLHHVQLLHGESDKPSSRNPVTAMYDEIFVAGQAAIDRYWDHGVVIPREKFRIVGRPQVAEILPADDAAASTTVMYAPTWNGFYDDANYSSLPVGTEIVAALLRAGATVVFREHPYTVKSAALAGAVEQVQAMLGADAAATGRAHRFGPDVAALDIVDCFNAVDALVTDVSSVPIDFLFSGKPIALVEMREDSLDRSEGRPTLAKAAYVVGPDADFDALVTRILTTDDRGALRDASRRHYLGDFDREGYVEQFPAALLDVVVSHRFEGELDLEA